MADLNNVNFREINNLSTLSSTQSSSSTQGSYRGQAVLVDDDPMSLIADAAEELTFAASETVERKVGERKLKEKESKHIDAAEKAEMWAERLANLKTEELQKFDKETKGELGDKPTPEKLKERVRQSFRDVSAQHAVLSYELEVLEDKPGNKALRAALKTAISELEAEHGPDIRAGYNIDGIEGGDKDLYRGVVLGFSDVGEAFIAILDRPGGEDFPGAVDYLRRALGADMSASSPSIDRAQLQSIAEDLYQVEVLGNLHADSNKMLGKLAEKHNLELGDASIGIMRGILRTKDERLLDKSRIASFLPLQHDSNVLFDVELTQGVKNLVHRLPLKVYKSEDTRQVLLNAIQGVVDDAIEREEQQEEAE